MKKEISVVAWFGVAVVSACVAAGTWSPVLAGVGEQTTQVNVTGILGTLSTLGSMVGGLITLFKKSPVPDILGKVDLSKLNLGGINLDILKQVLGPNITNIIKDAETNLANKNYGGVAVDVAFGAISVAILEGIAKGTYSVEVLTKLGELQQAMASKAGPVV